MKLKPSGMTPLDAEALRVLPKDWFRLMDVPVQVRGAKARLKRLEELGKIESRDVTVAWPKLPMKEWRRLEDATPPKAKGKR
jgi:hypothetical protein